MRVPLACGVFGVGLAVVVACGGSDSTPVGGDGGASSGATPRGTPPDACLDKPCTDIKSCFDAALGPDCAARH